MKINWKPTINVILFLLVIAMNVTGFLLFFPYVILGTIACLISAYLAFCIKKEKVVEVIKEVPIEIIKEIILEPKVENSDNLDKYTDIDIEDTKVTEAPKITKSRKKRSKKAGSSNNNLLSDISKER